MTYNGFLNIDKAVGMTSHDVVAQVRRLAKQKRIGHGGTLDPAATGVLPIGLGEATRLIEYLVEGVKGYEATIRLGQRTTTDDAEGTIIEEQPVPALTLAEIMAAWVPLTGVIQQVPPMYSAIQVNGQRMYNLARQGQILELAPRTVEVREIKLLDWAPPDLRVAVVCGKGTYIRALARDLGAALGCGAHLTALRRTQVGPLMVGEAVTLEQLQADPSLLTERLLPPAAAVADWPMITADLALAKRISHGLSVQLPELSGDHACARTEDGSLLALLKRTDEAWQPFKVFQQNLG